MLPTPAEKLQNFFGVFLQFHIGVDTASVQGIVERGGRIRRLMPRECLRLQGFDEDQIDRLLAITSDAQAYKQAGNSVCLMKAVMLLRNDR